MNCKQYQERILDALAAGEKLPPGEVESHRRNCVECRGFYESQASFFRSIQYGVELIANQPVPPSLLPRVRARLEEEPSASRSWNAGWGFAAVAAAVVAAGIGFVWHRHEPHRGGPGSTAVASRGVDKPVLATQPPRNAASPASIRGRRRGSALAGRVGVSEAIPEVIVLPEERAAFAKFVAQLPNEQDVALALARPAPVTEDLPIEIALLQIEGVEVKPLESTAPE